MFKLTPRFLERLYGLKFKTKSLIIRTLIFNILPFKL